MYPHNLHTELAVYLEAFSHKKILKVIKMCVDKINEETVLGPRKFQTSSLILPSMMFFFCGRRAGLISLSLLPCSSCKTEEMCCNIYTVVSVL